MLQRGNMKKSLGWERCRFLLLFAVASLTWMVGTPVAHAQVLYGSLVGAVTDPSGAAIPSAAITLTNKETGVSRDLKTDDGGRYSAVNVLPGKYNIKVVVQGFRTFTETDIDITPN